MKYTAHTQTLKTSQWHVVVDCKSFSYSVNLNGHTLLNEMNGHRVFKIGLEN